MSFRRFLYLAADDGLERSHSLRRIDMSRLFFRASTEGTPAPLDGSGGVDLSTAEDAGNLPDPAINLSPPHLDHSVGTMDFMLFKKKNNYNKAAVVCIDNRGRSLMVDPDLPPTVRALPSVSSPKLAPFSLAIGQSLYVMDAFVFPDPRKHESFEVLSNASRHSFRCKDWHWEPLDRLPPCVHSDSPAHDSHLVSSPVHDWQITNHCQCIDSYTVVAGSNMVVSSKDSRITYVFNTVKKAWNKAGDWALPFTGLAEYVPKQKLWFGISSAEGGHRFRAADLVASPDSDEMMMRLPEVRGYWKEYADPPPEWSLAGSYAVHLGSSKFCIARFFEIGEIHACPYSHKSYKGEDELQVLLTGVEVDGCGEGLSVLKHKSELYKLDATVRYQVL